MKPKTTFILPIVSLFVATLGLSSIRDAPATSMLDSDRSNSDESVPYQKRCGAPGVILCLGFDSSLEVSHYATVTTNVKGAYISFDPTVPGAEGAGAAKFFVPANTECGSNSCAQQMSGGMIVPFTRGFGQNSDMYFQFRQRWDSNYLSQNFNGEGWKQVIVYQSGASCASLEIMLANVYYRGYPQGNTDCGAIGFTIGPKGDDRVAMQDSRLNNTGDFLYEQGAKWTDVSYNCYRNRTTKHSLPNCALYQSNNWMTFYCHVHIGNFGAHNSTTKCWVAYEGKPMIEYINMTNMKYEQNNSPSDAFHTIEFTNYDSRASGSRNLPVATWYDSFILSTKPIPAPNGPTPEEE